MFKEFTNRLSKEKGIIPNNIFTPSEARRESKLEIQECTRDNCTVLLNVNLVNTPMIVLVSITLLANQILLIL